jgi:hypothetical protein
MKMNGMFYGCSSLKEANISNFQINKYTEINGMFFECLDSLKICIKKQFLNINEVAFEKNPIYIF